MVQMLNTHVLPSFLHHPHIIQSQAQRAKRKEGGRGGGGGPQRPPAQHYPLPGAGKKKRRRPKKRQQPGGGPNHFHHQQPHKPKVFVLDPRLRLKKPERRSAAAMLQALTPLLPRDPPAPWAGLGRLGGWRGV